MSAQRFIEQAMQHRLIVSQLDRLVKNLKKNPPSDSTATDLILWVKENFMQEAMKLALRLPVSPPNISDPTWQQGWANESGDTFLNHGGEKLIKECRKEIVGLHPQIPEVVVNTWLLVAASTAAQVVRMISCGLNPDLLRP